MPGFSATGLDGDVERLKELGAKDPEAGGHFVREVVEGKRDGDIGLVIRPYDSPIQPW